MRRNQARHQADPLQTIKKLFLSSFVVVAFAAYVLYERLTKPDYSPSQGFATATAPGLITVPAAAPSGASGPFAPTAGASQVLVAYKDGTYQGPAIDAYYGLVQVQATIKGGTIHDVQFLQYPNDRRTSQQINSIAMPYLQQEAIQAQSAQVNIISGATLTSEGFAISLQSALQSAHH
jgi:uncharacterized protein with FMN-binding domain